MNPAEKLKEEDSDAAELLRLAQKRFSQLIKSLPVGIVIVGADAAIEAVNPAIVDLLRYDERELVGQPLAHLLAKCPWSNEHQFQKWISSNEGAAVELEAVSRDGERVPVDLSVRQLHADPRGRLLILIQDVTDRYLAEQLKHDFYRMINHDIRAPLGSVLLFLESLSTTPAGAALVESERTRFSLACKNIERVVGLVDGLLQLDRLESGTPLRKTAVNIAHIIGEAVGGVRELADERHISLDVQTEEIMIEGDGGRLTEVLVNLLSNAIAHSPIGKPIAISACRTGAALQVSIRDHGPGVPDAEKQTIFETFKRGSGGQTQGHGLGLSICRTIIALHGGTIGCRDAAGGGSTFWFEIPAKD